MSGVQTVFWFSVGTGTLSWICYKMFEYEAETLKTTPSIEFDDLKSALPEDGTARRVALEGIVNCMEPIASKHHTGDEPVQCVVYSLNEIAKFATRGYFGWWSDEKNVGSTRNAVPFQLIGDAKNTPSVQIPALEYSLANGCTEQLLSDVSNVVIPHKFTFQAFVDGMRSSRRILRHSHFEERGLEVGTPLTIVGPVVRRKDGIIRMVSQPVVISRKTKYDLISDAEENAANWQYICYAAAGIAAGCAVYVAYKYTREYIERKNARQRLAELRERKERMGKGGDCKGLAECRICFQVPADTLILPCKHLHTCLDCTMQLNPKHCPICRQPIKKIIKVYN